MLGNFILLLPPVSGQVNLLASCPAPDAKDEIDDPNQDHTGKGDTARNANPEPEFQPPNPGADREQQDKKQNYQTFSCFGFHRFLLGLMKKMPPATAPTPSAVPTAPPPWRPASHRSIPALPSAADRVGP